MKELGNKYTDQERKKKGKKMNKIDQENKLIFEAVAVIGSIFGAVALILIAGSIQ